MDVLIDETETERELVALRPNREATFADAAAEWRDWAEHTRRLKPASLRSHDATLALPGLRPRNGGPRVARIMRAFGDRPIASITTAEIERFLRRLDREGLTGRNVNVHRQAVANVFEYATQADTFALPLNPVRGADKRREDHSKPPQTFTAERVMALARAARGGLHVNGGSRWASSDEDVEQQRANEQDAAIHTIAGLSGLRQGELRALRWRHVRFADRTLAVVASMSAGVHSSTKSGKWRAATPPGSRRRRSITCATRSRRSQSVASMRRPCRPCSGPRRSRRPSAICTRGRSPSWLSGWTRSSASGPSPPDRLRRSACDRTYAAPYGHDCSG